MPRRFNHVFQPLLYGHVAGIKGDNVVFGYPEHRTVAIHRLGENPELRGAMGVAARTAALTRWEKTAILRQLEAQLFALVAERAARRPLHAGVMSTTSDHE
jgi:hypothetical protein